MSSATKEVVHQGWLTKSPPTKAIFRPRWRRRWFIVKGGSFPHQFVLEYFTDESCRRQKGLINLDECEQVHTICGPLNVQDRHRYTFHLRTPSRIYYLASDTEQEMNKWVEVLCQVCGLKIVEDEADGNIVYARPSNENSKPLEVQSTDVHHESDDSSPTPSNKSPSGPYIPISECFTGKPIIFNPSGGNEEVTYYNMSSFPFPPKVNWATYPYKRDANEPVDESKTPHGQRSNDASYVPPRPPKKNSSKPTTPTSTTPSQTKPNSGRKSPDQVHSPTGHSAGIYENVDEVPDSSSTSSSLHSPPSSAGGLYCNISDTTESKTAGASVYQNPSASKPSTSPSPSSSSMSGNQGSAIPPKVDRNLKPEVKKANEINAALKNHQTPLASNAQSRLGCMTLPNKSSQNNFYSSGTHYPGPEIDRTRKPSDGNLTLGCTPAQLKYQSAMQNNSRNPNSSRMNTSTLPNQRRRAGPLISPHEKKTSSPIFHEYESTQDLIGTYMQIDCKTIKDSEPRPQALKLPPNKKLGVGPAPPGGSVEYKVIDHVKTKALNQMRMEREKQLETNPRH
ncbi:Protein daughter of sevenless [Orchesella cincta]|uniref:Protein daughter of sevenless n=1 Tax=Orchesella cincta TaxID=48709 RepID=A0A1D2MYN7_ORCCI|nr:Protein daughter of sevenless [Orchesella cincta]